MSPCPPCDRTPASERTREDPELDLAPARCRKCGFEFGTDKLRKPSKCPKCKDTWISEPRIKIERRGEPEEAE